MLVRNEVISENLRLVHACCHRYIGRGIEYDDLYQAGCIGLIKAADRFEEERGLKFSTYAVPVILGEIRLLFRESGSLKVSRALKDLSLKAWRFNSEFSTKNGRDPTVSELAEFLGVSCEQAAEAIEAGIPPVSLTGVTDDCENQIDIKVENFDADLIDLLALREVIQMLPENDRELIRLRYFSNKTQTETAKVLGMTQVQVSRREKVILSQMRTQFAS